jgi:hypothetical protein
MHSPLTFMIHILILISRSHDFTEHTECLIPSCSTTPSHAAAGMSFLTIHPDVSGKSERDERCDQELALRSHARYILPQTTSTTNAAAARTSHTDMRAVPLAAAGSAPGLGGGARPHSFTNRSHSLSRHSLPSSLKQFAPFAVVVPDTGLIVLDEMQRFLRSAALARVDTRRNFAVHWPLSRVLTCESLEPLVAVVDCDACTDTDADANLNPPPACMPDAISF